MEIRPHDRFSAQLTLGATGISEFATAAGDANSLHHNPRFADRSRYGGIVASGPQTTAHLMGLTATHFSREAEMVELEFSFRFRAPVYADEDITLEWLVISVRDTSRGTGKLVDLRGRIRNAKGRTAVGAKGRVLVHLGPGDP